MSFIRLAVADNDSLAWRTLLMVCKNGIGEKTIARIAEDAQQAGSTFADAVGKSAGKDGALKKEWAALDAMLSQAGTFRTQGISAPVEA